MNQTAAAVGNSSSSVVADATSTFTTLHLAVIAVLAVLAIAIMVYGARLKHQRKAAERAVEAHAVEAGVAPVEPAAPDPAVSPAPVAPVEVAPPLTADMPSLATAPEALADEPIAAAATLAASPASEAASSPGTATGPADGPVTQLKGLGPKVAARLGELGITTVGQIAALDDDSAAALDAQLGTFSGRMQRDRWIEQARFLAAGDRAGFEAVFGRL